MVKDSSYGEKPALAERRPGSPAVGVGDGGVCRFREQDRFLPTANIARIMKRGCLVSRPHEH